ncbi:hypothetical protein F2Q68_00016946 [Brassica cretica]|uniref:Uncharacterized protein n=1 Tax=Brassica cretica TaxID=69181 RepID=A0A8S9HUA9_BRACR|nr:hypothetical protein F2Q68_00016946 [Brassica cretica]
MSAVAMVRKKSAFWKGVQFYRREKLITQCGGEENVNDLVRQPFYRFLQRTLYLHLIAFGFLLHIWGGMPFLVWGMGVANVARSQSTFLVNSVCHTWGTRAWNTPDLSRNNWYYYLYIYMCLCMDSSGGSSTLLGTLQENSDIPREKIVGMSSE